MRYPNLVAGLEITRRDLARIKTILGEKQRQSLGRQEH